MPPPPSIPCTRSNTMRPNTLLLLLLIPVFFLLLSRITGSIDACDLRSLPDPLTLRPDQLTVLMSGISELRLPLLRSLAASYAALPSVARVLVLWANPSTSPQALASLSAIAGVSVLRLPSDSLNARFLPRPEISTRAVAVCDDDVAVDAPSLALAFAVWRAHRNSLVGFFARSHDFDLAQRRWIYTVHPDRYSIILTKFLILKTEYLHSYSCWDRISAARELVDAERNCEDILMNFVAAMEEGGMGPVLVQGKRVRDWGDPRNRGNGSTGESASEGEIRRVGLSTRSEHRRRRGDCITEFHRMLGVMPLRYSYGKVVQGVGEQGLCHKNGKLVYCDQD